MSLCPCGSGRNLDECCGPIMAGAQKAPTAEALMRARYSAHVTGDYDFLDASVHPDIRDEADHEEMKKWSQSVTWDGLEIVSTVDGGEQDETGEVTFIARYSVNGIPQMLHERAYFQRVDGAWLYKDGDVQGHETYRREAPKVGRNDPCPCGSGKKYKKCCGR